MGGSAPLSPLSLIPASPCSFLLPQGRGAGLEGAAGDGEAGLGGQLPEEGGNVAVPLLSCPLALPWLPRLNFTWALLSCLQEAWLLTRERELREEVRKERDKEIELVIQRLEADMSSAKEECERATENR